MYKANMKLFSHGLVLFARDNSSAIPDQNGITNSFEYLHKIEELMIGTAVIGFLFCDRTYGAYKTAAKCDFIGELIKNFHSYKNESG